MTLRYFAELDKNNVVIRVMHVDENDCLDTNGNYQECFGCFYLMKNLGSLSKWVETFPDRSKRNIFAYPECIYLEKEDMFIIPNLKCPKESKYRELFSYDHEKWDWIGPLPYPTDNKIYFWSDDLYESSGFTEGWKLNEYLN